jgi:hypothetical protein
MAKESRPVEQAPETADVRQTARRLARDVLVNVVANLVAAAVIYLIGVVAGLLPSSPIAIAAAAALTLGGLGLAIMVLSVTFVGGRVAIYAVAFGFVLAGASLMAAPLVVDGLWLSDKIGLPILGFLCISLGFSSIRVLRLSKRAGIPLVGDRTRPLIKSMFDWRRPRT